MSANETPSAVIIGAGGVLGHALTRELAHQYHVIRTRRTPAADDDAETALDLADRTSCDSFTDTLRGKHIAALIFNAARSDDALIMRQSPAVFADAVDTYVLALHRIITALTGELSGGSIVLIASLVGMRGGRGQAVYAAVKGALIGYAKGTAAALAAHDIRINAVLPGLFRSHINEGIDDAAFRSMIAENALKREQDVDEIARFVRFLSGMKNASGQVFNLDSRIT
ncbi:MAG: SDR family oxidoreductase [Spirochaetota bacterium]